MSSVIILKISRLLALFSLLYFSSSNWITVLSQFPPFLKLLGNYIHLWAESAEHLTRANLWYKVCSRWCSSNEDADLAGQIEKVYFSTDACFSISYLYVFFSFQALLEMSWKDQLWHTWCVCDSKLETISSFLAVEAHYCSAEKNVQISPVKCKAVAWENVHFNELILKHHMATGKTHTI